MKNPYISQVHSIKEEVKNDNGFQFRYVFAKTRCHPYS